MLLGAIADDFTGATDLASTLVREGMRVVQVIGVPDATLRTAIMAEADAVVIALKTRTVPVQQAVSQSLAALAWLEAEGARQILFKYCSTFDSTARGNIGPVADALAAALGAGIAVVCPAFPTNGRSIYRGHLFVGDQLLADSPMQDHPLTPMRQSNLVALMAEQSTHRVGLVRLDTVMAGPQAVTTALAALERDGYRYAVVDGVRDADLRTVGEALADHRLITGGSAIAMGLPDNFRRQRLLQNAPAPVDVAGSGRRVILAGSCSRATREQLAQARALWPSLKLDPDAIAAGQPVVEAALSWAMAQPADAPIIIFASADPQEVAETQRRYGVERAGAMIETAMGRIAQLLRDAGAGSFVVAGGETSGAVVAALGITGLKVGREIAPGVPWTTSLQPPALALALKSGNFGGPHFFEQALDMLE